MVTAAGRAAAVASVRPDLKGLRRVTAADRGLVAVPMLAPHLRFGAQPGDGALLAVAETTVELQGRCFPDLLPLLDGQRTRQAIAAELEDRHPPLEVQTALVRLAASGFVVSAEFDLAPELAAYWSALGASPRFAQERLAATPVAVFADDQRVLGGGFAARLAGFGAVLVSDGDTSAPAVRVVLTDDYLSARHGEFPGEGEHSASWTLIQPTGARALFGPIFGPVSGPIVESDTGADGPCWHCLARRMAATRPVDTLLRASADASGKSGPSPADVLAHSETVCGLAAGEIARWIVFGDEAPIHRRLLSFDAATSRIGQHHAPRRPGCSHCGSGHGAVPSGPLRLSASPKTLRNSGGIRSVRPEETLRRFGHLNDPVTGVMTDLHRLGDPEDPWFFVYGAWVAPASPVSNHEELRRVIGRGGSAGKGGTPAQAEASALCEAIERYSGILQGGETVLRRRMSDFRDGEALHPNEVELYSADQFDRDPIGGSFRTAPVPFDDSQALDWTPVWSFTADAWRYLPTRLLYYAVPARGEANQFQANSNGCASGNTFEEAILQGFFELVERDAFACWWYNRIAMPAVDLASFDSPYLAEASGRYERLGRELWLLDITHDLGIPVFIAISRRVSGAEDRILFGAGCHFDPQVAAMRALCELNQVLVGWSDDRTEPDGGRSDEVILEWLSAATLVDRPYLAPDPDAPLRSAPGNRAPATGDLRDDIALGRQIVEDAGMEFLVLDQTRPDVGLPVARVLVPGMRHFWARFAPGRLYDVPVAMGWRAAPFAESELTPDEPPF